MSRVFNWLVRREKFVVAMTLVLVVALVIQLKYCKSRVEPEIITLRSSESHAATKPSAASREGISGTWEMTVPNKKGHQTWTLTLEQNGEQLKGILNSEGGDLPVTGTIKGKTISLSAKKFGVTLELPASLNGETMSGVMRALTVERRWTAKRI